MKRTWKATMLSGCLLAIPLAAQENEEHFFTANVGGGFTTPVYKSGTHFDTGWNFTAGAGINPIPYLGIMAEFGLNSMGVNSATLNALQFPGGDTRIWSGTIDPVIRFNPRGKVSFYVIGGGGVYHRTVEFTQPTVATFTGFDPFFGVFYPVAVPANQVIASYDVTKGGVNGGAGLNFRFGHSSAKFYAEARYHHMYTRPNATTFLPVTFGVRF
jgi:outer membrane protein with beta-barrel domain